MQASDVFPLGFGRVCTESGRLAYRFSQIFREVADVASGFFGADPVELGRVAAFLLSPATSYVTGTVIVVDGGACRAL